MEDLFKLGPYSRRLLLPPRLASGAVFGMMRCSIMGYAWRIGGALGILWLVGVALLAPGSIPASEDGPGSATSPSKDVALRLQRAVRELDLLKRQNDDMRAILQQFTREVQELNDAPHGGSPDNTKKSQASLDLQKKLDYAQRMLQQAEVTGDKAGIPDIIPSQDFEVTRRLVDKDLQESWFYFRAQLKDLQKKLGTSSSALTSHIDKILEDGGDRLRVAQYDLSRLSNLDGLQMWRQKEASDLSDLIQNRLYKLQNPSDCSHARKLVCNLNKGCGYGCQIHHVVYCFIVAYGTKRTLILKSKNWRYNKNGWDDVFLPLSDTCIDSSGISFSHWPGTESTQVVELPIIDTLSHRPPILPLAIPKDLSGRITRLHGNPAAWWVGQFLKYMLKPQPKTQKMLDSMKDEMGFRNPIVGIHVRRTDKVGTEAAFHSLSEYMEHVEEFYKSVSLSDPDVVKRVYLASDDHKVIAEARAKFPEYTFYGDPNIAKTAAVATRYSDASLKGIIADIHFLSLCDYLVCTFSSQVCRIAYEIMQNLRPDAAFRFRSLDDIYYYGGQNAHNQRARFPHTPRRSSEMTLHVGDTVGVAGNHWNGFSKGINKRSRQNALYPSYKVEEIVDVAQVPSYADFDNKNGT